MLHRLSSAQNDDYIVVILRSVFSLVVILSPEGAKDLDSSVAPLPQNDDYVIVILRSVFCDEGSKNEILRT